MLRWTITFLVIAIIAAVFGFGGIAGAAAGIAQILFYLFLILFVISLIFGRRKVWWVNHRDARYLIILNQLQNCFWIWRSCINKVIWHYLKREMIPHHKIAYSKGMQRQRSRQLSLNSHSLQRGRNNRYTDGTWW